MNLTRIKFTYQWNIRHILRLIHDFFLLRDVNCIIKVYSISYSKKKQKILSEDEIGRFYWNVSLFFYNLFMLNGHLTRFIWMQYGGYESGQLAVRRVESWEVIIRDHFEFFMNLDYMQCNPRRSSRPALSSIYTIH